MTLHRVATLVAIISGTAAVVWWSWPRPDTLIRVQRGGVAVVTDALGRDTPLPDTVFVGGRGPKRKIRVVNEDTVQHRLAMFTVPAGQQTDYTVPPGTFGGVCSAHPTKTQLTFVIQ
ncbi:hypothetical protein [Gemmatimonas sp.]|jgi:hypothetical protein|uniref:hypothetical protein n=1 Tax=Gemmatimonas sp. TaxID=1962908 RepID=UPI0022CB4CE8|nr:hypothetical protein [Gemmatimonas sp.]MCZ8203017.1 hypothetical protein [Gemmatimonas sp.]